MNCPFNYLNVILTTFSLLPQFSGLYLVSLVVILIGFIAFNAVPTPTDTRTDTTTTTSSSICEEGYYDNPVATHDDITKEEVAVRISTEEEEQQEGGEKEERRRKKRRASGPSQSLERGNDDEDVGRSTKM